MAKDQAKYHRANIKARSTIINFLGPAQQSLVKKETTAKGVWDKLRKHYAQNIQQQISILKGQMSQVSQGQENIETYRYKIKRLCKKLEDVGAPVSGLRKLRVFL